MASLHDEDERNILRDNERFDPVQKEFESSLRIVEGFAGG
jgi:hypothetical protein